MHDHSTLHDGVRAPLVSVIVCTHRRPALLRTCLASLQHQDDPSFEVIVVDNVRVPFLAAADVERYGARLVHEPHEGLCFARNRGIAEARGDIIAFLDDDCEAEAGWVGAFRAAFETSTAGFVTGRVLPAKLDRRSERWFEFFASFDRGPYPRRFVYPGPPPFFFAAAALGTGCNMAMRRELVERVGLFDTVFERGIVRGGGDLDYFGRVLAAHEEALYVPGAVMRHHHRESMRALARQLFGYGLAVGSLWLNHIIEAEGRPRDIVGFHREWIRTTVGLIRGVRGRRRVLAFALFALLLLGDLCAPIPYAWHRWSRHPRAHRPAPVKTAARL